MLRGDEQLHSKDFGGYVLSSQQQLVTTKPDSQHCLYTLPGLQQYLVLQRHSSSALGTHCADVLALVPSGKVNLSCGMDGGRGSVGSVTVQMPAACCSKLQVQAGVDFLTASLHQELLT